MGYFFIYGADDRIVYSHFTVFVGPFPNRNGLNFTLFVRACYFVEPPVLIRTALVKINPTFRGVEFYGADDRIRTGDIRYHKPTL